VQTVPDMHVGAGDPGHRLATFSAQPTTGKRHPIKSKRAIRMMAVR
jgi:hypothetical protein